MKRELIILASIATVILMVSSATSVPLNMQNSVEESNTIISMNEQIKDFNKVQPKCLIPCLGIAWAFFCIAIFIILGWVPPFPF